MLKTTDINLRLITDIDMYQMVEIGLHGGVSYIANRYSKAVLLLWFLNVLAVCVYTLVHLLC